MRLLTDILEKGAEGRMASEGTIDLHRFARRVYVEAGEDGILEKIFSLLGVDRGYFVEFGAWDGKRLSNTRLLAERDWRGVLIEADPAKFQALTANVRQEGVSLVHAEVALTGDNALEAILERSDCPEAFDLLSIDVGRRRRRQNYTDAF